MPNLLCESTPSKFTLNISYSWVTTTNNALKSFSQSLFDEESMTYPLAWHKNNIQGIVPFPIILCLNFVQFKRQDKINLTLSKFRQHTNPSLIILSCNTMLIKHPPIPPKAKC
jgi:hypothetical protein